MDIQQVLAINIMVISALALAGAAVQGVLRNNLLWLAVNGLVVGAGLVLLQWAPAWSGTILLVLFLPLVVLPLVLARMAQSRVYQRRMRDAARLARLAALVHPTRQTRLNAALIEAQAGTTLAEQRAALARLAESSSPVDQAVIKAALLRLEGRWEELLALLDSQPRLERELGSVRVRALGEAGHVDRMTRAYDDAKARLHGAELLEAQLFVLAFTGRTPEVARLIEGPLSGLDAETRTYWTAVAQRAAGSQAGLWHPLLTRLAETAQQPGIRQAAARLLAEADAAARPVRIDPVSTVIVEDCAQRIGRAQSAGGEEAARATPVTWLLLAAIAGVYLLSESQGGAQNLRNLVDLGALWPPFVLRRGEWWRLATALFLHFGPIHAGVNAVMLVVLGRAVERMFGPWRMALIYGLGGLASSGFVLWLAAAGYSEPAVLVGASGAIMALFGGLVGCNLVTWLRYRDVLDGRNLVLVGIFLALQVAVDLSLPQVSLAAHASGFVAGLLIGSLLVLAAGHKRAR